jgi:hypothetical protein
VRVAGLVAVVWLMLVSAFAPAQAEKRVAPDDDMAMRSSRRI